jgi:anti-sigma regulatory factor (Ser/Thr protein kinase)
MPGRAPPLVCGEGGTMARTVDLLHTALSHLDEAALALSGDVAPADVASALLSLGELRQALSAHALELSVSRPRGPSTSGGPWLVRRLQLPGTASSAGQARSFCRDTCADWGLARTFASTTTDVVSELVANASQHAAGPVVVSLERATDEVLVRVWDNSLEPPRVVPYRAGVSERGIGLRLVSQLTSAWGWAEQEGGKQVWAQIALNDAAARIGRQRLGREAGAPL